MDPVGRGKPQIQDNGLGRPKEAVAATMALRDHSRAAWKPDPPQLLVH